MIREKVKKSLLLQLITMAVGIILVLCIGLLVTKEYVKIAIRNNMLDSNEKILLQIEGKIEEYYDSMKNIMTTVAYSPTVKNYYAQDENERVMSGAEISLVFSNAVLLEQDIDGIYLYDMSMQKIAEMGETIDKSIIGETIREETAFSDICYLNQTNTPRYLMYLPIYDLDNRQYGKQMGMCVFLMKTNRFQRFLEDSQITEHTEIYLVDSGNTVMESVGREDVLVLDSAQIKSDGKYYVRTQKIKTTGWCVVSRIPAYEIENAAEENMHMTETAYLIAMFLIAVMVVFCYRRILYRIHKIGKFINENVHEPDLRMEENQQDELGIVVSSLNQMLDEREHMNREILKSQTKMYEIELDKRQVQILAYRNQINPHFLYNTFDCIRSMALYHDVDDIAEITMALSKVFRFAVKAENIVTVDDEINYIQEYAKIIDYRFMGKIKVHVNVAEEVRKKTVIKLMLQPLVENAVFHGLEKKIEDGEVTVSVKMQGEDHLLFIVEDNGCGIPPAKVVWLRNTLDSNLNRKGIGIANIYQRLRLFYEDDVEFDIKSRLDEGTKITIIVPDSVKEAVKKNV